MSYSKEQTTEMVQAYTSAQSESERAEVVKLFSDMFKKTSNSIVAKLSAEKVYIKKVRTAKNGKAIVRKSELVQKIADLAGVEDVDLIGSLEKATKQALEIVIAQLEMNQ